MKVNLRLNASFSGDFYRARLCEQRQRLEKGKTQNKRKKRVKKLEEKERRKRKER